MNRKWMVWIGILFGFTPLSTAAQTPRPNTPLLQIGGVYPIGCHTPSDTDLASVCFVRTDTPEPVELGCTPALGPDTDVGMDLTILTTEGVDAEIHCYVVDHSGLVSDYSENAGLVDFTRPGRPYVQ